MSNTFLMILSFPWKKKSPQVWWELFVLRLEQRIEREMATGEISYSYIAIMGRSHQAEGMERSGGRRRR